MKEKEISEEIELPQGVEVRIEKGIVSAKGKKGECSKKLHDPEVLIALKDGKVVVSAKNATKRQKTKVGTYTSHVKNLVRGASNGYVYKLKICAGHFPMTVSIAGKDFIVKNFLGEKSPRVLKLKEGASVKIEGTVVTVESCNKEIAGQTAADIENLTRIVNRDLRVFQDGIYITEMNGKPVR